MKFNAQANFFSKKTVLIKIQMNFLFNYFDVYRVYIGLYILTSSSSTKWNQIIHNGALSIDGSLSARLHGKV